MKSKVLILCLFWFVIGYIYLLLPYTNQLRHLIPFRPEIELSLESHIYYLCERVRMVIFFYIVWLISEHYHKQLALFFWLAVVYLIDYILLYNGSLFYIGAIPVSYTLVMAIVMTFTVIKTIFYD